jgi:hypothetical protein
VEPNENGLNAAVPGEALDQHNRTVLGQTRYAAPPRAAVYNTPAEEREEPRQNQAAHDRSFSSPAEGRNICP